MPRFQFVGTAIEEEDEEKPASMSLAQRIAPSLAEFERARDAVTGKRLRGSFTYGGDRARPVSLEEEDTWKPASFVSSRNKRARTKAAQLEDLMDEEDLMERAPKHAGSGSSTQPLVSDVVASKGTQSQRKGFQLLRNMGWSVGAAVGAPAGGEAGPPAKRKIGPALPPGWENRHGSPGPDSLGRFLADVGRRKQDRRGIGSTTSGLGDGAVRPSATAGPVRQRYFGSGGGDDDDDGGGDNVYGSPPGDLEDDGGPVIVRDAGRPLDGGDGRPSATDGAEPHPRIGGYVVGERLEALSAVSTSDADSGDDVRHDFANDKFRKKLDLPSVLQDEAIRVASAEQRRLLMGEKPLPRSEPRAERAPDETEGAPANPADEGAEREKFLDAVGGDVSSRFAPAGATAEPASDGARGRGLATGDQRRSEEYFQPTELLARRFNVPCPQVHPAKIVATQGLLGSRFASAGVQLGASATEAPLEPAPHRTGSGGHERGNDAVRDGDNNDDDDDALERPLTAEEKPSAALFQAIFGDDSD